MKRTYVWNDGELVERVRGKGGQYHYVQPDITPYKSMLDGKMVTSRSQHRRMLKAYGCVEVGNDDPTKHYRAPEVKDTRKERLIAQVQSMTHAEANRILDRLRDNARFTNDPHRRK
jgi:hypothetical protein